MQHEVQIPACASWHLLPYDSEFLYGTLKWHFVPNLSAGSILQAVQLVGVHCDC